MSVSGSMPRTAVAREAENKKRRREMAFSVVFDLLVMSNISFFPDQDLRRPQR
jgi:hypothetical protein